MGSFILALDQGTTSSRAILFDRSGRVAAMAQPLSQAFGNELVEQLATEAKRRVGVKINKDLVTQLTRELTGASPVGE